MYPQAGISPDIAASLTSLIRRVVESVVATCHHLRETSLSIINAVWERLICHIPGSLSLKGISHLIFGYPSKWPVQTFQIAKTLLKNHPHVVHIVSFSIFFGPIVALMPFLFLHELAVALLFNLSFVMHGLLPGTVDSRYDWLRSTLQDTRESLYSSVDATGATYNKWTTEYMPLIILRLVALAVGIYALYGILTT